MSDAWGSEPGGPEVRKDGTEESEQWTQARKRVEKRRKPASDIVAGSHGRTYDEPRPWEPGLS